MISAISPIKYGDNERSRVSGIWLMGIGFQGCHQRDYNVMCEKRKIWTVIMSGC